MKKRLFLDTNIVLDLLGQRQPFYDAIAKLATLAEKGEFRLAVSALSFATVHYILSKNDGREQAREKLRKFHLLTDVIGVDEAIVGKALNSGFSDFEDALQYFCALQSECAGNGNPFYPYTDGKTGNLPHCIHF